MERMSITSSVIIWTRAASSRQQGEKPLEKILGLNGKTYYQFNNLRDAEGGKFKTYGFIAQDLAKIVPEAALLADDGMYAVDYDAIIPILVEAIKEQNNMIKELQAKVSPSEEKKGARSSEMLRSNEININKLYPNRPNPFERETTFSYTFDQGNRASLMILNLNGELLIEKQDLIKGTHEITVSFEGLAAGMYLYSLVVDGIEVETKRAVYIK